MAIDIEKFSQEFPKEIFKAIDDIIMETVSIREGQL